MKKFVPKQRRMLEARWRRRYENVLRIMRRHRGRHTRWTEEGQRQIVRESMGEAVAIFAGRYIGTALAWKYSP